MQIIHTISEGKMKKSELKIYKKLLEERKAELSANINSATKDIEELREHGATDEIDVASMDTDLTIEYSIGLKQRESLNKIVSALERIENGTYGECLECGEPISPERLKVRPESRLCISCKELAEKAQRR
ncbi:RNA polymerase-binding protein DksA [Campylobacter sp. JMF_14 EL1]|nr:RNA polymerase-binding protein DksA [Campylobacter sp. JMF_14 EL1]